MYFFKFLKWFCLNYLDSIGKRMVVVWFIYFGGTIFMIPSYIFFGVIVIKIYFITILFSFFIFTAISSIIFIRNRYNQWQEEIFDKLRENPDKDFSEQEY